MADPDLPLVIKIKGGDEEAFNELMGRYKRPILNFVYRMLTDTEEANDVAQDVFVRVYRDIDTYQPQTKFSTWLFALAKNASIDRLRYRKRHPTESLSALLKGDRSAPVAHQLGVAEQVSAHEIGEHIAAAVNELPEDQKTVLVCMEYQDMSYAEVAKIMKCSPKSVEARLYRAKKLLRKRLQSLYEEQSKPERKPGRIKRVRACFLVGVVPSETSRNACRLGKEGGEI